jgi:hypothetical protein
MQTSQMGFQEIRVKVLIEGDATRAELGEIVRHANFYELKSKVVYGGIEGEIEGGGGFS